jgi:hypothetical protein
MTILRDRRIAALPAAELVSSTGSQMTGLALPWFVLVTTGLMQQTAAFSITTSGICSPIGVLVAGPALVAFGARPVLLGIVCVQACGVAAWALAGASARAAGLVPDTIEVAT